MKKVGILREQNMYDQITQSHIYGEKTKVGGFDGFSTYEKNEGSILPEMN